MERNNVAKTMILHACSTARRHRRLPDHIREEPGSSLPDAPPTSVRIYALTIAVRRSGSRYVGA